MAVKNLIISTSKKLEYDSINRIYLLSSNPPVILGEFSVYYLDNISYQSISGQTSYIWNITGGTYNLY